jgi:hypothetical protein
LFGDLIGGLLMTGKAINEPDQLICEWAYKAEISP